MKILRTKVGCPIKIEKIGPVWYASFDNHFPSTHYLGKTCKDAVEAIRKDQTKRLRSL